MLEQIGQMQQQSAGTATAARANRPYCLDGALEHPRHSYFKRPRVSDKFEVPHPPPPSRARKFYEEKLGFTPKEKYAGRVIYECGGGSWVFMYPSAGARVKGGATPNCHT
jgi:hypothetical protein